jgi:hypothetical protein
MIDKKLILYLEMELNLIHMHVKGEALLRPFKDDEQLKRMINERVEKMLKRIKKDRKETQSHDAKS